MIETRLFYCMDKKTLQAAKEHKTRYQMIRDGEIEPEGIEKGWMNLQPIPINTRPPEEQREICSKGGKAVQKIHGEKKTARESLQRMLSILATPEILQAADIETALADRLKRENPDMTLYDVMNAAAIGKAISGNVASMQYVRDTAGDKPKDQIELTSNIMTDQDRELLQQISSRIENADQICIVSDQTAADPGTEREKSREKEAKRE